MPTEIDPILKETLSGSNLSGNLGSGYLEERQILRYGRSVSGCLAHGWLQLFDQNSIWGSSISGSLGSGRAIDTESWTYFQIYGRNMSGSLSLGFARIDYDPEYIRAYYPESEYQLPGSYVSSAAVAGSVESEYQV
jgi:hypothetical protein